MTGRPVALGEALRLIAITDHVHDGVDGLTARAAAAVRGGATMLQVRLKDADTRLLVDVVRRLVTAVDVPVLVNDRVDVALVAGAHGVHVGADDLPVAAARRLAPAGFIIGASLGSDAEIANARDADYAGIGPVFTSPSKPDAGTAIGAVEFARLRASVRIPCVGIGGITAANAGVVMAAGAAGIAVITGIFGTSDTARAARALRKALRDARRDAPPA